MTLSFNAEARSASASASASRIGKLHARQYRHRKRQPKPPSSLCLAWLGLCLPLAVILGARDVQALLPVGGGNYMLYRGAAGGRTDRSGRNIHRVPPPTPRRSSKLLCSVHIERDNRDRDSSNGLAQLSAPVLELITPDGCASSTTSDTSSLIRNIQSAVAGGVSLVQLRDYESDATSKAQMAARLVAATKGRALLVVNGDAEAARASGADGVHLPERMMETVGRLAGPRDAGEWPRVVGCSVHSVAAAVKAARLGADYVQVGTMFATQSHPGKEPEGVEMLSDVRRQLQAEGFGRVLVIGVGGIDASNCGTVVAAGGDGVAAIRCLCFSSDAEGQARGIVEDMRGSLAASGGIESLEDGGR